MEKELKNSVNEIDDNDALIELEDEDGNVLNFYHIATFPFENKDYVVFQPAEEYASIDEDEVVIYELVAGEDGEESFEVIEDDDLLDKVFNEFLRLVEESDDCECEGDCDCEGGCDCEKN